MNDLKNSLQNKSIAVFGMGVSGISALKLLHALKTNFIALNGKDPLTWAKKPGVLDFLPLESCYDELDPHLDSVLEKVDLVILSPGIPRDHPLLAPLLKRGVPIWGEIELAYRYLDSIDKLKPIIGITGTNGKTTTTTFLGEMIEMDHKKVFVGGNIGIPFCDYAFDILNGNKEVDYILLELSSFQLESIDDFHVDIAIILNLYQNHGERYFNIEDYGRAKFHITNRFTKNDLLIHPEDFSFINNWAQGIIARKKSVNTQYPKCTYDLSKFKLPGIHNKVNLNFLLLIAEEINLNPVSVQKSIDSFLGVHHRIEYVEHVVGLANFIAYNDAKSTNWDATITAIKAMEETHKKIYLILGGKKRGHGDSIRPYLNFFREKVTSIYLIGEMAQEIESEINGEIPCKLTGNLEASIADLRELIKENKIKGDGVLLFSPGFPSFDQFNNYAHRGECFVRLLQAKTNS